jgi:Tol biopolymer transport system component
VPPSRRERPPTRSTPPALLATVVVAVLISAGAAAFWLLDFSKPTPQPVPGATPTIAREKPAQRVDASGRLLVPIDAGLSVVELPSRSTSEIVPSSRSGAVTSAQWSPPDGKIASAFYHLRTGDAASSSEIFLIEPGGEPRVLIERDRPGTVVESPAWAPDGQSVYFSYSAIEGQRLIRRVERFDMPTGIRTPIINGVMPAVSPDGRSLAFVKSDGGGDGLAISDISGGNVRVLVPSGRYSAVGPSRFSPDGLQLAVPLSAPVGRVLDPTPTFPFGLLGQSVAHAHGDPWELYLVDVGGGEPRRLTRLVEDEITVAWSPEGEQLAVYGPRGLYLVRLDGTTTLGLDRGGYGGIDWAR